LKIQYRIGNTNHDESCVGVQKEVSIAFNAVVVVADYFMLRSLAGPKFGGQSNLNLQTGGPADFLNLQMLKIRCQLFVYT
jgi:hypothetical protein